MKTITYQHLSQNHMGASDESPLRQSAFGCHKARGCSSHRTRPLIVIPPASQPGDVPIAQAAAGVPAVALAVAKSAQTNIEPSPTGTLMFSPRRMNSLWPICTPTSTRSQRHRRMRRRDFEVRRVICAVGWGHRSSDRIRTSGIRTRYSRVPRRGDHSDHRRKRRAYGTASTPSASTANPNTHGQAPC